MKKPMNYGGQAVLEGVMMRGSRALAVAVRDPEGNIQIHEEALNPRLYQGFVAKTPFVRGVTLLWDALGLGMRSLMFSANVASGEEAEFEGPVAWGTIAVSLGFGLAFFLLAPAAAADGFHRITGVSSSLLGNLLEGFVRLTFVVGYVWTIGKIPDIKRVYQYHGAEHKTINAYEAGATLTPESVRSYPIEHPRCGTAFLLSVVVVSVFVFALLGRPGVVLRLASRIILLPVIAGIAYEYIRFTARNMANPVVRLIVQPNLTLQRLTTHPPDDSMLEVAIAALNSVLAAEVDEAGDQVEQPEEELQRGKVPETTAA